MTIFRLILRTAPWLAIVVFLTTEFFVDPGYWYAVTRVNIENSLVGTPPKMLVARVVHRPFHGHWTVTVRDTSGVVSCIAFGEADYDPATKTPPNISLDWWTFPTVCNLKAGNYTAFTSWRWRVFWLEREVSILSNIFTIEPVV